MFGLELLIGPIVTMIANKALNPTQAAEVAKVVVENPVATTSPVLLFLSWGVYKFFKTPDKVLKFRIFLRRFRIVGKKVLVEADALDKKLEKECAGGVCKLPEDT